MIAVVRQTAGLRRYHSPKIIIVICCHHSLTHPGKTAALKPMQNAEILKLGEVHGTLESWELVAKPRNNEVADGRPSAERWTLPLPHLTNFRAAGSLSKDHFKILQCLTPQNVVHGPAAWTSLGNMFETKTLRSLPRLPGSESALEAAYS